MKTNRKKTVAQRIHAGMDELEEAMRSGKPLSQIFAVRTVEVTPSGQSDGSEEDLLAPRRPSLDNRRTGGGDRVIVFDCRSRHADGADDRAVGHLQGQPAGESDQATV